MNAKIAWLCFSVIFASFCYVFYLEDRREYLESKIQRLEKSVSSIDDFESVKAENSCYVTAAIMKDVLQVKSRLDKQHFRARIVYAQRTETITVGHAAVVFYNDGMWRVYDETGTASIPYYDINTFPPPLECAKLLNPDYSYAGWMR